MTSTLKKAVTRGRVSSSSSASSPTLRAYLAVEVVEGRNLVSMDSDGTSDPYVVIEVGKHKQKTKTINNTLNPVWDIGSSPEKFTFSSKKFKDQAQVVIKCMDWDRFSSDDRMGYVSFKLDDLQDGKLRDDWFVLKPLKRGDPVSGELHLRVQIVNPNDVPAAGGEAEVVKPTHSPLWKAVKLSDLATFQDHLSKDKEGKIFTEKGKGGKTIFHVAVSKSTFSEDSIHILKTLLRHPKANLSITDDLGNTPLHFFSKNFRSPACAEPFEEFMKKKVNVNAANKAGETPLHQVVFNPAVKILLADLLLQNKADPNALSIKQETPLHFAVRIGRTDVVKLLVAHGADTKLVGRQGLSPAGLARKAGFEQIADLIRDAVELHTFLKELELEKYFATLLEEELYLYLVGDVKESALEKLIPDQTDRSKFIGAIKNIGTTGREKSGDVLRRQKHYKSLDKVKQRESDMRKSLRESLMRSRSSDVKRSSESSEDPPPAMQSHSWELDPGDLEFVKSLGSGTSGEVFKGLLRAKPVAVKVLKSSNSDKEKTEFIAEFSIIATLKSPYIVHFFGASVKDKLTLVMEFCERGSLYDVLQDNVTISWTLAFQMLEEVVRGIKSLHESNPPIMHRDLKTLNVLVTSDFHCKLCDFGLARFDTSSNLGTLKNCRGTYAYIAPEVYAGKKFTLASDFYAVSIMTWEFVYRIINGKYLAPFKEFAKIKMDFQILVQASMMDLRPTIPASFPHPEFISDVWNKDPTKRPTTTQWLEQLDIIKAEYQKNPKKWDDLIPNSK
eukprot:TRINITY_DN10825_c0_g1_i1.p1 TRINITY_DN10825_c0_g1~~TRINITY_DN10825_c0_g1_i1.p1  ORF type:complete len:823 (-),score=218.56 TRINITY_DN10825_c0_g1_i1:212-2566(-)